MASSSFGDRFWPSGTKPGALYGDVEAPLYPGQSTMDVPFRWAFIRKVYGILSAQLILTTLVGFLVVRNVGHMQEAVLASPGTLLVAMLLPLALLCALMACHQTYPTNFVLLGLFTASMSVSVGLCCAFSPGPIVLEALVLTATVVVGLTLFTFWAARQGYDFNFLGPMLFASLLVLVVWGLVQAFFPMGPIGRTVYALLGALIFSAYLVFDTDQLIKRHTYDEYIIASVNLYMDILNLFLNLLSLLRQTQE